MRNRYFSNRRKLEFTNSGDPKHPIYEPVVQKDGRIELEISGYEDTDEIIESQAAAVSLENIIARYANGDLTALNRFQGIYVDVSDYPKTLAESMQKLINAENAFNALPVDVKQKFGSDWRVWLSESGTEEWIEKMQSILKASESVSVSASEESEVKDGDSV